MSWPDMRKWTERKISFSALCLGVLSLIVSAYTSCTTNGLSEKTFCYNHIGPKLEMIKSNVYDLPRLISGCAIDPTNYCGNARAVTNKTYSLVLEVTGSLNENLPALDELSNELRNAKSHLKITNNSKKDLLKSDAYKINSTIRSISILNPKNIECSSNL